MRQLPWNKIANLCAGLAVLITGRAAVTIGRARYWHQQWLPLIREDPWIYVGFAAAAIAILAWTLTPPKPQPEETLEECPEDRPQAPEAPQEPADSEE